MTNTGTLAAKLSEWRTLASRPDLTWAEWKGEEAQLASALLEACDALEQLLREGQASGKRGLRAVEG